MFSNLFLVPQDLRGGGRFVHYYIIAQHTKHFYGSCCEKKVLARVLISMEWFSTFSRNSKTGTLLSIRYILRSPTPKLVRPSMRVAQRIAGVLKCICCWKFAQSRTLSKWKSGIGFWIFKAPKWGPNWFWNGQRINQKIFIAFLQFWLCSRSHFPLE